MLLGSKLSGLDASSLCNTEGIVMGPIEKFVIVLYPESVGHNPLHRILLPEINISVLGTQISNFASI
jgi:hypothetical protein